MLGVAVIATALPVAWFSFHWHFLIGLVATLIYGAAALTVGTACIAVGMSPIVRRLARGRQAHQLDTIPRARALPPAD